VVPEVRLVSTAPNQRRGHFKQNLLTGYCPSDLDRFPPSMWSALMGLAQDFEFCCSGSVLNPGTHWKLPVDQLASRQEHCPGALARSKETNGPAGTRVWERKNKRSKAG